MLFLESLETLADIRTLPIPTGSVLKLTKIASYVISCVKIGVKNCWNRCHACYVLAITLDQYVLYRHRHKAKENKNNV